MKIKVSSDQYYQALLFSAAISSLLLVVSISLIRTAAVSAGREDQLQALYGISGLAATFLAAWAALINLKPAHHGTLLPIMAGLAAAFSGAGAFPSLAGLFPQIAFLNSTSGPTSGHFLVSLVGLGFITTAIGGCYYRQNRSVIRQTGGISSSYARLSLLAVAAGLAVIVSGVSLSSLPEAQACPSWPLCSGLSLQLTPLQWMDVIHRGIVGGAAIIIVVLLIRAWREQRENPVTLTAATAAAALYLSQALLGGIKAARGYPIDLVSLHSAASAAAWAALVLNAASALLSPRPVLAVLHQDRQFSIGQRLKDFLILTKPVIVVLLLVTTYAGMVVGGRAIPPLGLSLWTLFAGALAAGGSGAINQYIDRDLDRNMQRTARRPLPAGRVTPAEGLAFGVGLLVAAFFIMAAFANLLAALLSLAGMVYYILLYSIFLKKATVQNIVIGGGAGAIPPLVGWAAASGGLSVPSLFLFAIIFMWTPPHFWALALVRRKDYARAGVPMLPVVRGEKATQLQILIYTLELVGVTLLMPAFKLAGSLFLISAVVLGGALIYSAWRVYHQGGNKTAWQMYRYSSMYLAFIFAALVLDVLI